MARKERNDVDYFPHSVNHGKKMFFLRDKYGNDGYAVWFMLLEHLGKASYHYLNLSDEVELMYLSSEFKVTEAKLKEIINDLVKLGEFDKELWEKSSILFNEKFVENIADAYNRRNNECVTKKSLLIHLEGKCIHKPSKSIHKPDKCTLKGCRNPQTKVKYTKVKYIKGDKIEKFKKEVYEYESKYDKEMLDKFIAYWVEPNKTGKLRMEGEKYWALSRRLATWKSKSYSERKEYIHPYSAGVHLPTEGDIQD